MKRFCKSGKIPAVFLVLFLCCAAGVSAEKKQLVTDPLKITLDDSTGAFSIAISDSETGNWVSLLESAEHGTTSGLYIRNGSSIRKMAVGTGVVISADTDDVSATLSYTVPDEYVVELRFEPFAATGKKGFENIRVDVSVRNISSKPQVYSVKAVFDTWLGERSGTHFVCANTPSINTECQFDTMSKVQYIRSAGMGNAVQFLLYGADISVPDGVYIANRDVLLQDAWTPAIREGRTFDSIQTYNNSAVGINWHQVSLPSQTKSNLCFYITTATGGKNPGTVRSLGLDDSTKVAVVENELPTYTDSYGTTYTLTAISDEQLDPAYITDLLSRIKELEKDSDQATRDEIRKLNAELDAIFAKLGRASD